ncbi:MAG: SurA N-terminal domain-containing protein [Candidatus Omnitrophica bacterium]|nr:SurA N-terminal domain-containing protein [Candidatus Omnitrophota bacterium]
MKIIYFLILGLVFIFGCQEKKEVIVKIDDFKLTRSEFEEKLKEENLISASAEEKDKFLDKLINQKILLLEAERLNLDKKREFLKEIENFYERMLVKEILDLKSKEFAAKVFVDEIEIQNRYKDMLEKNLTDKTYDEIYEQLRWQILKEKQTQALNDWLLSLRKKAKIKVNPVR